MLGPGGEVPSHVLVVSHGYEPLEHVSATRGPHMARELASLGWEVSALTLDWSQPPPAAIRSPEESVRRALGRPSPRVVAIDGRLASPAFDPAERASSAPPPPAHSLLRRLATLRRTLGWGSYEAWAHQACAAAERLHTERPIHVIWAIHGDDSCHAIAAWLARRLEIPWVADFKDPWDAFHARAALPLQRWATARRLRGAAALTETCRAQAEADARRFGQPAHVVYSGYDADLMARVPPERPDGRFAISYPGSFGRPHDLRLLAPTFAELRRRGALEGAGVHQYGPVGQLAVLLGAVGCADVVREHGRVPRARAFALMRGSDVLLLVPATATRGVALGLKEIEALAAGTPVLVLGEPLAELLPLMRACPQVCVARSAAEAADFAVAEMRAFRGQGPSRRGEVNAPPLGEFTWPAQGRALSRVLAASLSAPPAVD